MATLTIDKRFGKVVGYNIQWYDGIKRHTIHLGGKRYNKATAKRLKEVVDILLYQNQNGIAIFDKATMQWVENAPENIKSKLAKAGLIAANTQWTCLQLWNTFLKQKTNAKLATVKSYRDSQKLFFEVFLPRESIEQITSDRLLAWRVSMLAVYAEASVATHIKNTKAVLNWAVRQDWIAKNPMNGIAVGSFRNRDKDRIVTMEEYALLLDSCPNQEWRTIIALARIGGLRCPSELQQLRWKDVDWEQNRFLVHSPKTERHANHATRLMPLFDELKVELQNHFSDNENEFVVQGHQKTDWNLSNPFQKILERAGLGKIACPFANMRRSRANEVVRRWGEAMEKLWIGHTADVMEKHYLCPLDTDFAVIIS